MSREMTPLSPNEYALEALSMAKAAKMAGTFAVGGVLLDDSGKIWKTIQNNVVKDGLIFDPTAHGERQLISWYFEQREAGIKIPPPNEMTIVSSLDPCIMCTGALLISGINVVVISYDDIGGVNWKADGSFASVPERLRPQILKQFAYFGLYNSQRPFFGTANSIFNGAVIASQIAEENTTMWRISIATVHAVNHSQDPPPIDIKTLGEDSQQLQRLREHYLAATELKIHIKCPDDQFKLLSKMTEVANASVEAGGTHNAAALLDPFGNLLLVFGSAPVAKDPTGTPLMRLTRVYASCRRVDQRIGALPHPKRCTFVVLHGPDSTAEGLIDLAVFGMATGSSINNLPNSLFYFYASQNPNSLTTMVQCLPPVYVESMKIHPVQIQQS